MYIFDNLQVVETFSNRVVGLFIVRKQIELRELKGKLTTPCKPYVVVKTYLL